MKKYFILSILFCIQYIAAIMNYDECIQRKKFADCLRSQILASEIICYQLKNIFNTFELEKDKQWKEDPLFNKCFSQEHVLTYEEEVRAMYYIDLFQKSKKNTKNQN